MISGAALLSIFIWIVVIGLVFWLLWWLLGYIALPEPFNKILRVLLALIAVVFLINQLLKVAGYNLID
jgi:hypothetical protein